MTDKTSAKKDTETNEPETIELEPGIYYDLAFKDYIKVNAINHSELKNFRSASPAHYKYKIDNGIKEEKDAFTEGRIYHYAILEPEFFENNIMHEPNDWRQFEAMLPAEEIKKLEENHNRMYDGRTKAYKIIMPAFQNQVKEAKKKNPDLVVIDYLTYWKALQMRKSVLSNKVTKRMLTASKKEVSLIWIDKETGLKCKGRLDIDNEERGYFADLKKVKNAHPYGFAKDFRQYNYYSQFAFYKDGAETLGHKELTAAIVIAIEDFEPFYVQPFFVRSESSWMEEGRKWYRKAIEELHFCMETGDWHGYYDKKNDSFKMFELPELAVYQ